MESSPHFLHEIHNPVDLALSRSMDIKKSVSEDNISHNNYILEELDNISADCNFHQRYMVMASQSFVIEKDADVQPTESSASYIKAEDCLFSGNLITYAVVEIGRIELVNVDVKALCLTFDEAIVLSSFERIKEDFLLHVPVYAIDALDKEASF